MTTRSVLFDCATAGPAKRKAMRTRSKRRSMAVSFRWRPSDGGRWRPGRLFVERIDRPRQLGPGEVRQYRRRQARAVDLVDLVGLEEFVEAAAEMAAALDHDDARLGNVEAEHLELPRAHALPRLADHHDVDDAQV